MADIPTEQQAHRIAFGKSITAWMRLNGWSQQTMHDAAKAWELQGPYGSQISLLQRGKHDPKPQFWVSLGDDLLVGLHPAVGISIGVFHHC